MGIKVNVDTKAIEKKIRVAAGENEKVVIAALTQACEKMIRDAKALDTYKDQTNNLRSSIGYAIYQNGVMVTSVFSKSGIGDKGDGIKGIERGRQIADEIATGYTGIIAVVVAGMNYASEVEARGKDVLTGTVIQANDFIKDAFTKAKIKYE
jgi:hypothetical protein